jgi:hypothetical protein
MTINIGGLQAGMQLGYLILFEPLDKLRESGFRVDEFPILALVIRK